MSKRSQLVYETRTIKSHRFDIVEVLDLESEDHDFTYELWVDGEYTNITYQDVDAVREVILSLVDETSKD